MKLKIITTVLVIISVSGFCQTLYIPGGPTLGGIAPSSNGSVGIGKSTPSTKLDVNGNFQVYPSGNAGTYRALKLQLLAGTSSTIIQANSDENWANHDVIINAESASSLNSNQLVVHCSGNVGIGTSVPKAKLDITNNYDGKIWNFQIANEHHDITGDQSVGMKFKLGADGEMDKWSGILGISEGIWENYVGLAFYTTGYAAGSQNSEKMRISSNGDVGIGTTSPDAKLTVKGHIHTQEVRVDLAGSVTPDYVFEKDYNLLPLSELETYITKNKHLPEVPSAKEMEADGLNLKEMNLILLKKVEELTLHLIEINKSKHELSEQVNTLQIEMKELKTLIDKK